jgi:hypothetical protein
MILSASPPSARYDVTALQLVTTGIALAAELNRAVFDDRALTLFGVAGDPSASQAAAAEVALALDSGEPGQVLSITV